MTHPLFSFYHRGFLTPDYRSDTSYIHAEIECTYDGKVIHGTNVLTIADCRRSIQLEFFLGNPDARKESLEKIQLMVDVLTEFRDALKYQIDLIEKAPIRPTAP
jgi:hypothetical protein